MNEQEAIAILGTPTVSSRGLVTFNHANDWQFINYWPSGPFRLDGEFYEKHIEAMLWWIRNKTPRKETQ